MMYTQAPTVNEPRFLRTLIFTQTLHLILRKIERFRPSLVSRIHIEPGAGRGSSPEQSETMRQHLDDIICRTNGSFSFSLSEFLQYEIREFSKESIGINIPE